MIRSVATDGRQSRPPRYRRGATAAGATSAAPVRCGRCWSRRFS